MPPPAPTPRDSLLAVGELAPDFTIADQARKDWTLSDAVKRGDVVLCFYPFAFTGTCGVEMKCVSSEMAAWKAKGAEVVGVSCDSPFVQKAWAAAEGFGHSLLSDQHRHVTKGYGLYWPDMNTTRRGTVVIGKSADGKGRVKWLQAREPGQAMDWEKVLAQV